MLRLAALVEEGAPALALDVATYHRLRRGEERGTPVRWRLDGDMAPDAVREWVHLRPPVSGGGAAGDRWRRLYLFGSYYLRWGPTFCLIRDRRPGEEASLISIDDAGLLGCMRRLDDLTDHVCDRCAVLEEHAIVHRRGELRTLAPVRLQRPPIPFSAV